MLWRAIGGLTRLHSYKPGAAIAACAPTKLNLGSNTATGARHCHRPAISNSNKQYETNEVRPV